MPKPDPGPHKAAAALANLRTLADLCEAQHAMIASLGMALEQRREDIEQRAARAKLAHGLQAPVASLAGTVRSLAWPNLTDDARDELVASATRQSEQLQNVVDDLLGYHDRPYEPVARVTQELTALRQVVDDAVLAASSAIARSQVINEVPASMVLLTQPGRLRQMVVNLLVNVGHHCPEATRVVVRGYVREGMVYIEVHDAGPGIDPALAEVLFEPFRRGPASVLDGGQGMGLYVVRALARSLGGEATLSASPSGGTVARVGLPQKRATDPVSRRGTRTERRAS